MNFACNAGKSAIINQHIKNRAWLFMHDFFSLPMAEQENQARSARLENRLFYSGTLIKFYLSATPRAAGEYSILT